MFTVHAMTDCFPPIWLLYTLQAYQKLSSCLFKETRHKQTSEHCLQRWLYYTRAHKVMESLSFVNVEDTYPQSASCYVDGTVQGYCKKVIFKVKPVELRIQCGTKTKLHRGGTVTIVSHTWKKLHNFLAGHGQHDSQTPETIITCLLYTSRCV